MMLQKRISVFFRKRFVVAALLALTAWGLVPLMPGTGYGRARAAGAGYVQGAASSNDVSASSIALAFSVNNTAGNLIVAAVSWDITKSATVSGVSDALGNAYSLAVIATDGINMQGLAIYYAINRTDGSNTVTANFSPGAAYRRLAIQEYSGITAVNPVDATASYRGQATTAANNVTSTSANTTASGDLIFGAVMDTVAPTSIIAGTGFTQRQSVNNKDLVTQDMIQVNAGAVASTNTFGNNHYYLSEMVAFKSSGITPPPAVPTISSFSASPSTITAGSSATLSWQATGATSISIDQGVGTVTGTSKVVNPTQTTTYTLTATNSSGSMTGQVTVTVNAVAPPSSAPVISSFISNPAVIIAGQSSMLSWSITDAAILTIDQNVGDVAPDSSKAVSPAQTTTYTLTATNSVGSVTKQVTVTVNPATPPVANAPVISSFSASPATIISGESSTLSWSVTGAASVSIDQGIGAVSGSSRTVSPAQTVIYTLTASNSSGSVTAQATVAVNAPDQSPADDGTGDTQDPQPVSNVSTQDLDGRVILTWSNPVSSSYAKTIVMRKEGMVPPVSMDDGSKIYEGTAVSFTDNNLVNGQAYSYAFFTVDQNANYSPSVAIIAVPVAGRTQSDAQGAANGSNTTNSSSVNQNTETNQTQNADSGQTPATQQTAASRLRLINNNGVYYLIQEDGKRHGVTNPGILHSHGFEFKDAVLATTADIALPEGELLLPGGGALVKTAADPTVYLISGNTKHGFASAKVFTDLGFKFSSVLTVTSPELAKQPSGPVISNGAAAHLPGLDVNDKGTVYYIGSDNKKYGYPSLPVYNSWRIDNNFSGVVPANAADENLSVGGLVTERVVVK